MTRVFNEGAFSSWARDGWKWVVTAYYGPDAKPPKREGAVAFQVRHRSAASKDVEVAAAEERPDIGVVDVRRIA